MKRRLALAALAVGLLASGCSQIDSLAPVSGGPIATLENAVGDVLVSSKVPLLVAPTCLTGTTSFTCAGSTLDGDAVTVTATMGTPQTMTITVGDKVLYDGGVQDVLDAAAQETP